MTRQAWTVAAVLALTVGQAGAQGVIKIGEINSYKAMPAFLEPYKKGMELAVEQINAGGGIAGKKLELVTRDDNGNPGDAVRAAEELYAREKIDVLTGSFLSHVGLALTDYAQQKKRFFLASETLTDKVVWAQGNRYTYRLRGSTYMQVAMLVPEAAKLKKKRWAIVYPNYEYGQSAVATFKKLLKEAQPDVERGHQVGDGGAQLLAPHYLLVRRRSHAEQDAGRRQLGHALAGHQRIGIVQIGRASCRERV